MRHSLAWVASNFREQASRRIEPALPGCGWIQRVEDQPAGLPTHDGSASKPIDWPDASFPLRIAYPMTPIVTAARSALFWSFLPFVAVQGLRLRRIAPRLAGAAGESIGRVGSGRVLRLLAIGDSIIAGVGAATLDRALVGCTARALADTMDVAVEWEAHGRSGATSAQVLTDLVPTIDPRPADAIVVSVGVNDVTALSTLRAWRSNLLALVAALHRHSPGAVIVVAGLPPLRLFPLIPEPLRRLIGLRGETLDAVSRELLRAHPGVFHVTVKFDMREGSFCPDGFHPSEQSYIEFGQAMAASIAANLPRQ